MPSVLGEDRFIEEAGCDDQQRHGKTNRDERRGDVRQFSNQLTMLLVAHCQAVHHVAEQQEGEINRSSWMNQRHGKQGQAEPDGVVFLPLLNMAKQHKDANDQAQLTRYAGKSRVEGLGEQAQPQAHGEHGVGPCTVAVHRPHEPQQQHEERVVAKVEHGRSCVMVREGGHPCCDRWIGGWIGPKSAVGTRQAEIALQHQLLG